MLRLLDAAGLEPLGFVELSSWPLMLHRLLNHHWVWFRRLAFYSFSDSLCATFRRYTFPVTSDFTSSSDPFRSMTVNSSGLFFVANLPAGSNSFTNTLFPIPVSFGAACRRRSAYNSLESGLGTTTMGDTQLECPSTASMMSCRKNSSIFSSTAFSNGTGMRLYGCHTGFTLVSIEMAWPHRIQQTQPTPQEHLFQSLQIPCWFATRARANYI